MAKSRMEQRMLDMLITYIEEDYGKTGSLTKTLDNAKVFLNKTTTYVEEEGYSEIFNGFVQDLKKGKRTQQ
jgi:hypothetical protein